MINSQAQVINGIRHSLSENLPKGSSVLLYGSQARGDARPDSDWDILIIVDKDKVSLAENTAITYPLVMYGWTNGLEINPVVYTKKEWAANKNTPFAENVERDALQISGVL